MCITRSIFRWGLISALALGGLTLLIGPDKVAAGLYQVRNRAQMIVDSAIDDPVALRRQLEGLADEYPDRIATVRGELAEVEHQIAEFEDDNRVSGRVVALTTEDLGTLHTLVKRAEIQAMGEPRSVMIRFKGVRFDLEQAISEANRINDVRVVYQDRGAANQHQLMILDEQRARLIEIADRLETEYTTFQTQLWQLESQIDAIERNERLIAMTKEMQSTLAEYDSWGNVGNLGQIQAKLAELHTIQEAQWVTLRNTSIREDYAERARFEMDHGDAGYNPASVFDQIEAEDDQPATTEEDSVAWLDSPVVIE